jgi:ATP-binding cassette subfamily F protein uup
VEAATAPAAAAKARAAGALLRAARKEVARLERELERLSAREGALHESMTAAATDHERLRELNAERAVLVAERERLEAAWFEASATLEG